MSAGTDIFEWSYQPKSLPGSWKEDRLISISQIDRALSTPNGAFEVTRITVVVSDEDGLIRGLLTDEETSYWDGWEGDILLLSDEGLEAGLEPWTVFRGILAGHPQLLDERIVSFEVIDIIGSEFSAFNLERDLAIPIGDEHENLPEDSVLYYPIVLGEHNDVGSKSADGLRADKGLIPGKYTGMYRIGGGGEIDPTPPPMVPPPSNLQYELVGPEGDQTRYFFASVITPYGESRVSDVLVVRNAPTDAALGLSNYVKMRCDFDAGPNDENKVRWWGRYTSPPTSWLDESYYGYGQGTTQPDRAYYNDGAKPAPTPTTTDVDHAKSYSPPIESTAVSGTVDDYWGMIVVSIGEVTIKDTPYASNLAPEAQPTRAPMDPSLEGVEYILPTSPQWPFPNPWIEKANSDGEVFRFTAALIRGPRLQHHIDETVTIAFNVCGYRGTNNLVVTQAFYQLQLFFNEFVFKDRGKGYRRGDMHTLETYVDSRPVLQTTMYERAQQISKTLIGNDIGFLGAWCIDEPMTLREFIRRFFSTFGALMGVNHFGQPFPVLPYTTASLTTGRLYKFPYNLESLPQGTPVPSQRVNRLYYDFDWDTDLRQFRVLDQGPVEDIPSQQAHGTQGQRRVYEPTETLQLYCTRDPATALAAMSNFISCYRKAPIHYSIPMPSQDLTALHDELGDRILVDHWNSLRPASESQVLILRHLINPNLGEEQIILTAWDMVRVAT
jgi:hypothetical protein